MGQQLGTGKDSYIHSMLKQKVDYDLGIIAGRGGFSILSHFIIGKDNDGTISIESTKLEGMKDHIIIPAQHSLVLFFQYTARKVLSFLRDGMF